MQEHGPLPRARHDGLLEETVGEELLLYDQESHTAHCLSPIAAYVWRHCNGEHDTTELAELARVSESLVAEALHNLREKDLLVAEPQLMQSTIPGESRREAIGRVARYGTAAVAGSMVVSATAATPAMAASGAACCQCVEGAANCDCTTWTSEKQCDEFCAGKTKCPKSGTVEGFKKENQKCEATGVCA